MAIHNQLTTDIEAMLADAVHSELFASHLYKHVANQMQRLGYFGAQKFFLRESTDELDHYQRHVDYLNDRGSVAMVPSLAAPAESVTSLQAALQLAYDTEYQLQQDYAGWYSGCTDPITQQHLLQYLDIQRKSVGEYGDLLSRLSLVSDDSCGILLIDKEMGKA